LLTSLDISLRCQELERGLRARASLRRPARS
jgi:hypothetical protein